MKIAFPNSLTILYQIEVATDHKYFRQVPLVAFLAHVPLVDKDF